MIKVCLIGVGRTGKEIAKTIFEREDVKIVSAICSNGSFKKDMDLGRLSGSKEIGIKVEEVNKLEESILKHRPDVIVDFSNPEATLKNANIISELGVNMVIGTTGFSSIDLEKIKMLANKNHVGIVYAPNITFGINILMVLSKIATILLNNYDFQISEIHHKNKKDIPSGTALMIAEEIKNALLYSGKDILDEDIAINSVRAGGVVGKHEVLIAGEYDKITISHESFSRKIFAEGAIKAMLFIQNKKGFYEMNDVLNLSQIIMNLYSEQSEENLDNVKDIVATDIFE